jgi:hypothetical protein
VGNLWVEEVFVDKADKVIIGEHEPYETAYDNAGDLYKALASSYGRCQGKTYVEIDGEEKHTGWIFEAKVEYDDCEDTFVREVWVTVLTGPHTVKVTPHYAEL